MPRLIAREPFVRQSIAPGMRVTLHFSLLLADGREVDSTRRGRPASFVMGDGTLPECFERLLLGLQPADDRQFEVNADDAFGPWRVENLRDYPLGHFRGMDPEPGLVVSFREPGGEVPGVIRVIDGDRVEVDFNHPLAGRDLIFDVSIIGVGASVVSDADHSSPEGYRPEP